MVGGAMSLGSFGMMPPAPASTLSARLGTAAALLDRGLAGEATFARMAGLLPQMPTISFKGLPDRQRADAATLGSASPTGSVAAAQMAAVNSLKRFNIAFQAPHISGIPTIQNMIGIPTAIIEAVQTGMPVRSSAATSVSAQLLSRARTMRQGALGAGESAAQTTGGTMFSGVMNAMNAIRAQMLGEETEQSKHDGAVKPSANPPGIK